MPISAPPACSATSLHRDLNARAATYAAKHQLLHAVSPGRTPGIVFGTTSGARPNHGNFHAASYRAICANPPWMARLGKAHTASRRARPLADWSWRELDCAASSDALLMNVFCFPRVLESKPLQALLNIDPQSPPVFGVRPRLARERDLKDTTEIDMQLDTLLVEAKLTESGFQTARPALLDRFPLWQDVFEEPALPRNASGAYLGYQLIRGILAAHASGLRFCLFTDARRIDLIRQWHAVLRAVPSALLRCRLQLVTWQELAAALPKPLRQFLAEKYGICAAGDANRRRLPLL
jgi:hypothetical protein